MTIVSLFLLDLFLSLPVPSAGRSLSDVFFAVVSNTRDEVLRSPVSRPDSAALFILAEDA